MHAILNGGVANDGRILKEEMLRRMLTWQLEDNDSQGLCWHSAEMITDAGERTLWGHTGGDPGITTYLFFDLIDKVGVITFQNRATGGTDEDVTELLRVFDMK